MSIQISLNGLSFCILNTHTNTVLEIKQNTFDKKVKPDELLDALKHLFNSEKWTKESFTTIQVIHINELATLVPKPFFDQESIAEYLKLNSKILKTDYITFDEIMINDSINVYVPYVNVNNYIHEHFGDFNFKHYSTVLIEEILTKEKNASNAKVYVHVNTNHFEIIATKSGGLILYNTFEYASKEDFIYYILFTLEQLSFNPELIEIVMLGKIKPNDTLYNILYKYVRHISFGTRNDSKTQTETNISEHANFTLLTQF